MEHARHKPFQCSLASVSCIASLPVQRKNGITCDWLVKPKKKVRLGRPRFRSGAIPLSKQEQILREYYAEVKTARLKEKLKRLKLNPNQAWRARKAADGKCICCGKKADYWRLKKRRFKYCLACRTRHNANREKKILRQLKASRIAL